MIDPDSGNIISRAGGRSPNFPPPWVYQTPAFSLFSIRPGTPDKKLNEPKAHSPVTVLKEQNETKSDGAKLDSRSSDQDSTETNRQSGEWTSDRRV